MNWAKYGREVVKNGAFWFFCSPCEEHESTCFYWRLKQSAALQTKMAARRSPALTLMEKCIGINDGRKVICPIRRDSRGDLRPKGEAPVVSA
jgi:hypothetical protein